jgi:hypothetical protein
MSRLRAPADPCRSIASPGGRKGRPASSHARQTGPTSDKVQLIADNLHLDRMCVSDERLTTYTFGGNPVTIAATGTPPQQCADLGGVKRPPDTCVCVPPSGGGCNPSGGKSSA